MIEFLRNRLFEPIGMHSAVPKFDGVGTWVGSSYVFATARDFAKFGDLYRNDGVTVGGERILPEGWAGHARTFVAHDEAPPVPGGFDYGRHWWMWPEFPGSLAAHGYEGQYIVVVPDRELIVVHLGKTDAAVRQHVVAMLRALIREVPPT
jgi:CubicO group peptidase (beta-lactamase class C family)